MRGRLDEAVRFPINQILVDFDDVGFSFMQDWHDISDYVTDISGSKEKESDVLGGVSSDVINMVVDNSDNIFSKDNSNSPFYGKMKNNIRFCIKSGFKGEVLTDATVGYIKSFKPRWKNKEYLLSGTCPMEKLKKSDVPSGSFQDITWDEAVEMLIDEANIDPYFIREIPTTEYFFKYLKFEQSNCFDALKQLMQMAVGQAYFEGNKFIVHSKLALDYTYSTTEKHTVIADDPFEFEENIDDGQIVNSVSVISNPKEIGALEIVWQTPENFQKVQNEQVTYTGGDYIYINPANLPLYWDESEDITIKNLTNGNDIEWEVYNAELGRIKIDVNSLPFVQVGHKLSLSYTYQMLVLLPNESRKFVASFDEEVASLIEPDVIAWNANATARVTYSEVANVSGTLSKQSMALKEDGKVVELTLKNNTAGKVAISTVQMRGYPIKVLNPIEVYNKSLPSINEYNKKEVNIQNDYINSIGLAEKISQYIIDNFSSMRKNLSIQINAYPELLLNDIMKVTEPNSGTDHKFTIERIDFTFTPSNGWTANIDLLEIDIDPWVYDTFSGESYNKTNTGTPSADFIEEINANMITNGGAELHSGSRDTSDVGAIDNIHRIPEYWGFQRLTGNASARVRVGGNFIIHGKKTFEIATTNAGTGYFFQIVEGIIPETPYTLTFQGRGNLCTGRAIIEEYDISSNLLDVHEIVIDTYRNYELSIDSLASTEMIQVKFQKDAGSAISELWFDKVKLENSEKASPYIETEESNALQIDTVYANSITIGNQYGIEVYDQNDEIKVRMGQYEPDKYGLKIYGGAIEIVNGLPKEQIDPVAVGAWDSAEQNSKDYADGLKDEIDLQLVDINNSISDLEGEIGASFRDGIISEAEAISIRRYLNILNNEKTDIDERYSFVYGNADLLGTAKTNLASAKTAYNTAHTNLINSINTAIADNSATTAEIADVDSKFTSYRSALLTLSQRFEQAIDYIAQVKADRAQGDAEDYAADIGTVLREDLRITSPLPNSISMDGDGITAYTTADPTKYARLDYRGLFIKQGALMIEGGLEKSQLATTVQTEIDQALVDAGLAIDTANTAQSAASSAQSTANTANSTANTANSNASSALSAANSANNVIDLWKYPSTTLIDGGEIYTGTVTANKINVSTLSAISANLGYVNAGTIVGVTFQTSTGTQKIEITGDQLISHSNSGSSSSRRATIDSGSISVGRPLTTENVIMLSDRITFGLGGQIRSDVNGFNIDAEYDDLRINPTAYGTTRFYGNVNFSSATVSGLTVSNASYATNAGNATTLQGYASSAFSFSGHSHSDTEYVKPYTGQALYLWINPSTREFRVYNSGGSILGRITLNA